MKHFFFLLLFLTQLATKAQDTIFFKTSNKVAAYISEVSDETIKYKRADNREGPTYTTPSRDIKYILYANGMRENTDSIYKTRHPANLVTDSPSSTSLTATDMFTKGDADARKYYKHAGGSNGILTTSILIGVFAVIPAIIVSSTPPRTYNLNYQNEQLWKNADYRAGYTNRAKKMKQGRVWSKFGVGVFIGGMLSFALTNM